MEEDQEAHADNDYVDGAALDEDLSQAMENQLSKICSFHFYERHLVVV